MIVKSVRVQRFRSIFDETLDCDQLTALVGRNGSGKSSFLRAIELFYEPSVSVAAEDFYAEDTSSEIEITITYTGLDGDEKALFAPYLDGDNLPVVRVLGMAKKTGTYHGLSLQDPEFDAVRNAGGKKETTKSYNSLRKQKKYQELPAVTKGDDALAEIRKWEQGHPTDCKRQRDEGQFFGFTEVGQGYLGRYTKYIHVPAVRDASDDAAEKRGSCITEIMDLVVRSVLAQRQDLAQLKADAQTRYEEIMDPANLTELSSLQGDLTKTLQNYAPETAVSLSWASAAGLDFPLPKANVRLLEDGYEASVDRTGHGLQRAFILTMLQHLAVAREAEKAGATGEVPAESPEGAGESTRLPDLVLGIEEPELYQHPSRQRHMAQVFLDLASGAIPGVAKSTQVVYGTHSPLFVGIDRFDQTRLLRKVVLDPTSQDKPRVTRVSRIAVDTVAEQLWELDGKPGEKYTGDTLMPRLQAIMTPWMNEGFFADTIVLVEGEGDRAAILGAAAAKGHDLESMGVCVVPCMGKENLDRPWFIFRGLGISVYAVWDSDNGSKNAKPERNRRLCRLVNCSEEDWPESVCDCHASFKCNLEEALRSELTAELYDRLLGDLREEYGMKKRDQARKNAHVIRRLIDAAGEQGKSSPTLDGIVGKVVEMRKKADLA